MAFIFLIQTLWMSGSAAAFAPNQNAHLLICNPSGQVTSDLRAANEKLLVALGLQDETPDEAGDMHCAFCAVSHVYILSDMRLFERVGFVLSNTKSNSYEPAFIYLPHGPPVGGRAPPHTI